MSNFDRFQEPEEKENNCEHVRVGSNCCGVKVLDTNEGDICWECGRECVLWCTFCEEEVQ